MYPPVLIKSYPGVEGFLTNVRRSCVLISAHHNLIYRYLFTEMCIPVHPTPTRLSLLGVLSIEACVGDLGVLL
jgi:hypothetical protein